MKLHAGFFLKPDAIGVMLLLLLLPFVVEVLLLLRGEDAMDLARWSLQHGDPASGEAGVTGVRER